MAISPLQVLEVKLYWKPLGHLHSYMPGVLTHRAGSLQMLGYNWHSSISGTDRGTLAVTANSNRNSDSNKTNRIRHGGEELPTNGMRLATEMKTTTMHIYP